MKADFTGGWCCMCDKKIAKGADIVPRGGGYAHRACVEEAHGE